MLDVFLKYGTQVSSVGNEHPVGALSPDGLGQRSVYAFILGRYGADFFISIPAVAKTASNAVVNLLSRSRTR
jgi:hypothetical protein